MVPVLIAGLLAMVAAIVIGPKFIEMLRARNLGQQIRAEGPAAHVVKQGTPTMGGLLFVTCAVLPFLALSQYTAEGLAVLLSKKLENMGSMNNSDIHMIYVLLDGVGDLPHPDLDGKTPLEAAKTPTLDKLAQNGVIGEVVSVGKGIAPESDIAVFNMLGYRFHHVDYAGRGVIEAIGVGIDFKDGDLALRGNYATLNDEGIIIDRRAGRHIEKNDADGIAKEI